MLTPDSIDPTLDPRSYLPAPDEICCFGVAADRDCTCWEPIYDGTLADLCRGWATRTRRMTIEAKGVMR